MREKQCKAHGISHGDDMEGNDMFTLMGWLLNLACGALAGWIAGKLMGSEGDLVRNLILGLVGGVVGSIVLGIIGIHGSGLIGGMIVSVVGACILIWAARKFS